MSKTITTIPAFKPIFLNQTISETNRLKVAAYARVSTDTDEQFTSFEAQVDYYTKYIASHSDWEFVKVYADEGISGTSIKHRVGFNEMIDDALAGKIDLIITKSISRFARNTVDTLTTVRKLKDKGVEVFFEKENIYTLDSKGELLITIMSSLAQEESRSISENVTWGQRKRFADGKVTLPYKSFLGYEKGEDGRPKIVESQAKIVRRIFRLFLEGLTPTSIAKKFTEEGIPTPTGKSKWQSTTVESILTNEKYTGDALLQKGFTVDYLTKKRKVNEGEIPQYFVEGSHEGIITHEVFDLVQYEFLRRKSLGRAYVSTCSFSSRIICGECGGTYGSKVHHSTSEKYRRTVFQCNLKYKNGSKGGSGCKTPILTEAEIQNAFIGAFNSCIENKDEIIKTCKKAALVITDKSKLELRISELSEEITVVTGLLQRCIDENAHNLTSNSNFSEKYESLTDRYEKAKAELSNVREEINRRNFKRKMIDSFLTELQRQDSLITEFDINLWNTVVETMVVYSKERMVFIFKDGSQVEWSTT